MKSTKYTRFCRHLFANVFETLNISETNKNNLLEKANILMVNKEYYAMVLMNSILGFIFSFTSSLILYLIVPTEITLFIMIGLTKLVPVSIGFAYL